MVFIFQKIFKVARQDNIASMTPSKTTSLLLASENTKNMGTSRSDKGKAEVLSGKGKQKIGEGSTKTTSLEKPQEMEDSDEELQEAELEAYIEEGANAGADFPLNKDITLRQDMLSEHLKKLEVSLI